MPIFRKKPVVIEARHYEQLHQCHDLARWCGGSVASAYGSPGAFWVYEQIVIPTMEGDMLASVGDWIIKGVQGEFYPCKPDIFEKTYEVVES